MVEKKKRQVAVVGLGPLGRACANALAALPERDDELVLAGMVRRAESLGRPFDVPKDYPVVGHVRDLPAVDVVLLCVPPEDAPGAARELLQGRIPVVECAGLEGGALEQYYADLNDFALAHRAIAIVGAGWDPGLLPMFTRAFRMLIPHGHDTLHRHPGVALHHSAAVAHIDGIEGALTGEYHGPGDAMQRYVYVQIKPGADFDEVRSMIEADPLFAGESTQVFRVENLAEIENEEGHGVVLERLSAESAGIHSSLQLEARYQLAPFAAQVMLDGARRIFLMKPGAHRYTLSG